MCTSIPTYPGRYGSGASVMQYFEDLHMVAACGTYQTHPTDQNCYQLSAGAQPAWQAMPPLEIEHCPFPSHTSSHYYTDHGWLVIGQDGDCNTYDSPTTTELFDVNQNTWTQPQIISPTNTTGYPWGACSVKLDEDRVLVSGGNANEQILSAIWILNLNDFSWSEPTQMPEPRYSHGCTLTSSGEVMIAGGYSRHSNSLASTLIYNVDSNTWRETYDLPEDVEYTAGSAMLLWNGKPIFLEAVNGNIWMLDNFGWERLEATLGAEFNGGWDTATLVPASDFECP